MRRSTIQIDGGESDEDDDMSFVESDDDAGGSLDFRGAGMRDNFSGGVYGGSGRGLGASDYGGSSGAGYGGGGGAMGGDQYSFDFPFENKAMPFSADAFDLDGGPSARKKAPPMTSSSAAARSVPKAAAKSQSSAFGAGKTGVGAKTGKVNLDDKFGLGRFNIDKKQPAKTAAAKEDFDDLDAFLNASDTDEEKPKAKPKPSAVSTAARNKAADVINDVEASDSEEDSCAPSPVAAQVQPKAAAVSPQSAGRDSSGSDISRRAGFAKQITNESSGSAPPPRQALVRKRAAVSDGSVSPAASPRIGNYRPSSLSRSGSASSIPSVGLGPPIEDSIKSPRSAGSGHSGRAVTSTVPRVTPSAKASSAPPPAEVDSPILSSLSDSAGAGKGSAMTAVGKPVALGAATSTYSPREASSVTSPRQATATYTEDFVGESANQLGSQAPALTTYDDDFEADANLDASASQAPSDASSKKERMCGTSATVLTETVRPAVASTTASTGVSGGTLATGSSQVTSSRQYRRPVRSDSDDDDYRPRRPTCHQAVQVSIPVDVGVQCDPPPPDPRAPDDPFGAWMQAAAAAHAAQAGSQPSMFGPAYGGLPMHPGGVPPSAAASAATGAYGGMPFSLPWYPHYGGPVYGMQPPAFVPPPQGPSPVLRHLFGAAIGSGSRGASHLGRPREAWGPNTGPSDSPAAAEGTSAGSSAMPAAPGMPGMPSMPGDAASTAALLNALGMLGSSPGYASASPPPLATREDCGPRSAPPPVGAPPMALALGMVNSSFQEPINALRQAVERHGALLKKHSPPEEQLQR